MFNNIFQKIVPFMRYVEKYGTARQATNDNIIRRMRFACWITKATDTHSEYVILIAFPSQQWLRERASVLRYTYIVCLVFIFLPNTVKLFSCCQKLRFFNGIWRSSGYVSGTRGMAVNTLNTQRRGLSTKGGSLA
jgi:hypothetical protein